MLRGGLRGRVRFLRQYFDSFRKIFRARVEYVIPKSGVCSLSDWTVMQRLATAEPIQKSTSANLKGVGTLFAKPSLAAVSPELKPVVSESPLGAPRTVLFRPSI